MRALTLKPEFADAVADGRKKIENRSWGASVRGRIAIHRGGRNGAIIALATVVDVVSTDEARRRFPDQEAYISGPLCWVLEDVERISPVRCRGQLSLWTISDDLLKGGQTLWPSQQARAAKVEGRAAKVEGRAAAAAGKEGAAAAAAAGEDNEASRRLCEAISELTGGVTLLAFSRGKDSIACWLQLRRYFRRIIPFHCASVPHLGFVDRSLDYYERFFDRKIERFLSGECSAAVSNLVFQPGEDEEAIDAMGLWKYDNHALVRLMRRKYRVPNAWCAYGINLTDSIDRRIYVSKYQGRIDSRRSFYPCFDWTGEQIVDCVRRGGVKLPEDYVLASRTLAGLPNNRHLERLEAVFPEDMDRVETLFPFIRARLARNAFRSVSVP